jgi:AAA-like domain
MNSEQALETVEKVFLSRSLNPIERLVLHQSWLGKAYDDMAQDSGYGSIYIKEVGSRLWQDISKVVGYKVTKKNLHLILQKYTKKEYVECYESNQYSIAKYPATQKTAAKTDGLDFFAENDIEFPGGTVPLKSKLYISRPPIEELACNKLNKPGCVIRVKAPKKMGKSSLLQRIIAYADEYNYNTVYLDFQEADSSILASLDKFLRWFCANISRQLDLNCALNDYWDEDMGSKVSCKIYFQEYLLESINNPLVLVLNEVNRVFQHPDIASDFLPMLRFWHEMAQVHGAVWQKLRLVMAHSTEIYIPLKLHQSPFNVGLSLKLPQFTTEQVQELAIRYGLSWIDSYQIKQLMTMVGGHPYLINLAFYHLWRQEMTLQELLQAAPTQAGIYSDHLRGHLAILLEESELLSALQQVFNADRWVQIDAIAAYKLESMGLVELDGNHALPSCELYHIYFREQLEAL